ncbi:MAG: hypothetical protein ACI9EM_000906 [Candidatus Thalassarchaeaceae archaeon]
MKECATATRLKDMVSKHQNNQKSNSDGNKLIDSSATRSDPNTTGSVDIPMKSTGRRRRKTVVKNKPINDGDARITSFLVSSGVISIVVILFVSFTSQYSIGPEEGQIIPNLGGEIYESGSWSEFDLHTMFDRSWTEGDEGDWIYIQILDTDCPYCYTEGDDMSDRYSVYGSKADFISIVVELGIPGHDGSQAEMIAFKDKTSFGTELDDGNGCNSGKNNCENRPGEPHNWGYVNDLDLTVAESWDITGTPFNILLKPNGEVAWNQAAHGNNDGQSIDDALQNFLGA